MKDAGVTCNITAFFSNGFVKPFKPALEKRKAAVLKSTTKFLQQRKVRLRYVTFVVFDKVWENCADCWEASTEKIDTDSSFPFFIC